MREIYYPTVIRGIGTFLGDACSYLTQADSNYYRARYVYLMSLAELDRAVGKR
jgi:hypothetical protein